MPDNMLTRMEFDQRLEEMGDDLPSLVKFLAREQYQTNQLVYSNSKKIKILEERDKKFMGVLGGVAAIVGATIAEAVNYFLKRN